MRPEEQHLKFSFGIKMCAQKCNTGILTHIFSCTCDCVPMHTNTENVSNSE